MVMFYFKMVPYFIEVILDHIQIRKDHNGMIFHKYYQI